ncbi:MAG: hypothetical protein ACYDCQ_10945 [Dehalococcoidia bacterium]
MHDTSSKSGFYAAPETDPDDWGQYDRLVRFLRRVEAFHGCTPETLREIARVLRPLELPAGGGGGQGINNLMIGKRALGALGHVTGLHGRFTQGTTTVAPVIPRNRGGTLNANSAVGLRVIVGLLAPAYLPLKGTSATA